MNSLKHQNHREGNRKRQEQEKQEQGKVWKKYVVAMLYFGCVFY